MKKHSKQGTTNGAHDDGIATSTLESAIDSDRGTQWLAVLDFHGTFQVFETVLPVGLEYDAPSYHRLDLVAAIYGSSLHKQSDGSSAGSYIEQ
jgi:hypothetical protein